MAKLAYYIYAKIEFCFFFCMNRLLLSLIDNNLVGFAAGTFRAESMRFDMRPGRVFLFTNLQRARGQFCILFIAT